MTEASVDPQIAEFLAPAGLVAAQAAARTLDPPPPLDLNSWAARHVVFGEDAPYPGPYDPDRFPHMREIFDALSPEHPARTVTLMGSAQGGKTFMSQVFLGAVIESEPAYAMMVHPALDGARRWSQMKWTPFVKAAPNLARMINVERRRDSASTILYQEAKNGAKLTIKGANSPASLSQDTIKYQVQDDLSKWEDTDHGDPESLADNRSAAHPFAKIFKVSVGGIKGQSKIGRSYAKGSQASREAPCPHCGHYQVLTWDNFRALLETPGENRAIGFSCTDCGALIEERHKLDMIAAGRWVHKHPERISRHASYHIWAAYMPNVEWQAIAEKWLSVKGNPTEEQAFYNDTLGLDYEIAGESPPADKLQERAEASGVALGTVPPGALILTAGVDVQGDRLEARVWGFGPRRFRAMIHREIIPGRISEDETQARLKKWVEDARWTDAWGARRGIDMVAIDSGYQTGHVYDLVSRMPRERWMAIKGSRDLMAPELLAAREQRMTPAGRKRKGRLILWQIGVSRIKAAFYADLAKTDPTQRGYVLLPAGLDGEEFQQLTAEKFTPVTKRNGYKTYEWRKSYERNEALDCYVYAEAAARRLEWHRLTEDDWDALIAERERPPASDHPDLFDPSIKAQASRATNAVRGAAPTEAAPPPEKPRKRRRGGGGESYI